MNFGENTIFFLIDKFHFGAISTLKGLQILHILNNSNNESISTRILVTIANIWDITYMFKFAKNCHS